MSAPGTDTRPPASDYLSRAGERYFLSPVCLVPNGRSHLGHISGPLLRTDVVRRHLLRAGAEAIAIGVSDCHESHVLVQAFREGRSPEVVARDYHSQIHNDLLALEIEWDDFLDPLDPSWNTRYRDVVSDFTKRIIDASGARAAVRRVPVLVAEEVREQHLRPQLGDPVLSGWLRSRCPGCGEQLVGFFCEQCGGSYEPDEVLNAACAHFAGSLDMEEHGSIFLTLGMRPDKFADELSNTGVTPEFRQIVERHLERAGPEVRLTIPSPWGIPFAQSNTGDGEVIWSYSALLMGCHLVAGERCAEMTGYQNPFSRDSNVRCVISFGIDNTIPYLLNAQACLMAQDLYKPVDFFLTNHFALLDGAKFSTSRRHVIWAGDLVGKGHAHPDLTRLLLCLKNPQFARVDFNTEKFAADHASLGRRLQNYISRSHAISAGDRAELRVERTVQQRFIAELTCQDRYLSFESFDLRSAARTIIDWLDAAEVIQRDSESSLTWLLGLAMLAAPFMPTLSQKIWADLGRSGSPMLAGLADEELRLTSDAALREAASIESTQLDGYATWVEESQSAIKEPLNAG